MKLIAIPMVTTIKDQQYAGPYTYHYHNGGIDYFLVPNALYVGLQSALRRHHGADADAMYLTIDNSACGENPADETTFKIFTLDRLMDSSTFEQGTAEAVLTSFKEADTERFDCICSQYLGNHHSDLAETLISASDSHLTAMLNLLDMRTGQGHFTAL